MRLPKPVANSFAFIAEVVREYIKDNGNMAAAAVAFYVFLSLIPLLLLAVAGAGYLLGSPDRAEELVFGYVRQYSPALVAHGGLGLAAIVREIVAGRGAATGVGLVLILWSGTTVIVILERAINMAWGVTRQRPFWLNRLIAIGMLLIAGALFGVSFGVTAALDALKCSDACVFGLSPSGWPDLWRIAGYLIPLIITVAAFTLVYEILPCARVPFRSALFGGLFAGILWEAAKIGFSYYLSNFAGYSKIYGSLAGVILLMVWVNYSAIVTILGAEAASVWAKRHLRIQQ